MAQSVFANLIDYQKVKIINQRYLPWQSQHVFMAPQGNIHIAKLHFKLDYAQESIAYQAVFIHEMTHILQYQKNMNVLLIGAVLQILRFLSFGLYNPYTYILSKEQCFFDYNIEQQGDIAKDIFLKKFPILFYPTSELSHKINVE